jgi:hypothetical protein
MWVRALINIGGAALLQVAIPGMGDRRLVGGIAFEQTLTSYIEVDLGPEAHFVCIACQPPPYVADQSEASLAVGKIDSFTLHRY